MNKLFLEQFNLEPKLISKGKSVKRQIIDTEFAELVGYNKGYGEKEITDFVKAEFLKQNPNLVVLEEKQEKDLYLANSIINKHKTHTEILIYDEPFENYGLNYKLKKFDYNGNELKDIHSRFLKREDNAFVQQKEFSFKDLEHSLKKSADKALDFFKGFGFNNKFDYFLTLTFDSKLVDRYDDAAVKYLWQKFRQKLQNINDNVKILCVAERHDKDNEDGNHAIHFHSLVGDIDLTRFLKQAINNYTGEFMYCSEGLQIYNLLLWQNGYSTVVCFSDDYNNEKITNYCCKYITKSFKKYQLENYNKRYYFRTHNLYFKEKKVAYIIQEDLSIGDYDRLSKKQLLEKFLNQKLTDSDFGKIEIKEKEGKTIIKIRD